MKKKDFLERLQAAIHDLAPAEQKVSLDYYNEMIDERIEAGMPEEAAVAEMGSPEQIAAEIRQNTLPVEMVPQKQKPGVWTIILLILGSPIWLSLLIALCAVVLSVYIALWSVMLSLWSVVLAMLCTSLGCFWVTATDLSSSPMNALLYFGTGAVAIGIGLLMMLGCKSLTLLCAEISAKPVGWLCQKFNRKAVRS